MLTNMTTLTTRATARLLGVSMLTLAEWSASGVGPLPNPRGRYIRSEVNAWRAEMDAQLVAGIAVRAPGLPIAPLA